ncbi:MAG TPA: type II toxin-antitoxin system RatA family toxin [Acidiferrobacterales bacterium]|nr:type II toxin-antitoxin system RatA family toxin [Acidiferrobacterales bacterium]
MTSIHKSALVPYSAHEMFQLVADIESYGGFLPWCSGARIVSREPELIVAAIDVAYSGVRKTFTTQNRLNADKTMEMRLLSGPFSHLQGYWHFHALDERASKISLDLEFKFSNKMLDLTLGPVFTTITNSMVDSFQQRAVEVYGKR